MWSRIHLRDVIIFRKMRDLNLGYYIVHQLHLTCKAANKCLNVRERMKMAEWNRRWYPPFPLLPCELSVSVKENPDSKKKPKTLSQLYLKKNLFS